MKKPNSNHVREYHVKELGDMGYFSITHVTRPFQIGEETIEPGFYGIQGCMTITRKCDTEEEAEQALTDAVNKNLAADTRRHRREIMKLFRIRSNLRVSGLREYHVSG